MDIEITDLLGVATLATSFLAYIEARKANKNSKCDEIVAALGKVISASEKTQSYLLSRAEGGVSQVSCRIKLNFMPPALLLFSLDLNLLH